MSGLLPPEAPATKGMSVHLMSTITEIIWLCATAPPASYALTTYVCVPLSAAPTDAAMTAVSVAGAISATLIEPLYSSTRATGLFAITPNQILPGVVILGCVQKKLAVREGLSGTCLPGPL